MFQMLHAQAPAAAPGAAGGMMGQLPMLLMMGGLFAVFYFLLIRPQQKRAKELEKKRNALQKGDRFVTQGGVYATVSHMKDDGATVVAEIAKGVEVEVVKSTIMTIVSGDSDKK